MKRRRLNRESLGWAILTWWMMCAVYALLRWFR